MRKSDIEERMRQSLQKRTDPDIEESRRGAVMLAARQEYRAASGNRRISFWQFMAGQVRFMGLRTWGAQAAALMTVYAFFYTLYRGDMGYLWGRHLPVLLCFASVFLLFPSLPMLARSRRYQMAETEQVSRFSSNPIDDHKRRGFPDAGTAVFIFSGWYGGKSGRCATISSDALFGTGEYLHDHCCACGNAIYTESLLWGRDRNCGDSPADVLLLPRFL